MSEQKRILFLYTELAGYFLACVRELVRQSGAEVHIVRWPLNSEAPFQFSDDVKIKFYDRQQYSDDSLAKLVGEIDPQLIYCSGWIDKGYVKISRQWKGRIPVVAGIDTKWNGSLKQQVHRLISPFTVKRNFSHLWVAGEAQKAYARKLGFPESRILTGVYSADVPSFEKFYYKFNDTKAEHFPKRFVFVGRYLEFKGIFDLWKAFIETFQKQSHDWELWCLGTGEAWDQRVQHEKIKHLGFVQPGDMENIIGQTGVFILPSHFEPWAVAVHEFAAAGFPLICSNQVGAATRFLEPEKNGYIFESGNVDQLRDIMLRFIQMDAARLNDMGGWSHHMALSLTPVTWARTLLALT